MVPLRDGFAKDTKTLIVTDTVLRSQKTSQKYVHLILPSQHARDTVTVVRKNTPGNSKLRRRIKIVRSGFYP
jgi:stalled ribosome rescue protein Dom34